MNTKRTTMDRLRRVTDLFTTGKTLTVGEDENGPVNVWVQKPNSFQRSEAQRDGIFGRNRRMLSLTMDSPEVQVVLTAANEMTDEQLLEAIVAPEKYRLQLLAVADVKADEKWADDLVVLERWDELVADAQKGGASLAEGEEERLTALNLAYIDAVTEAADRRVAEAIEELRNDLEDRDAMIDKYLAAWKEAVSLDMFAEEQAITDIYHAVRDCSATKRAGDDWDHTACTHPRLLTNRASVRDFDEGFLTSVRTLLRDLQMTPAEAGNSDAPASSSASSGRASKREDSTPSTPEEAPSTPAGT